MYNQAVDILLNPNVAYLLLVAGIVMAVLALISPGTGLLEIGALFALLLAGWGVYQLPIHFWALGVLLLGAVIFILALRKPGRTVYLVISILALVLGSAFLFRGQGWQPAVHPALAGAVSALTVVFFWIAARKALEAEQIRPTHDLDALIGAIGEAKTDIYTEGTVQVAGELWSAYSENPIHAESSVRVVKREGLILEVETTNHSGSPA
jgi:membrane-bound serine protease (ClpP class)